MTKKPMRTKITKLPKMGKKRMVRNPGTLVTEKNTDGNICLQYAVVITFLNGERIRIRYMCGHCKSVWFCSKISISGISPLRKIRQAAKFYFKLVICEEL